MAYCFFESFRRFLCAHKKTAPFRWILKRGKKKNGCRRIPNIEDSSVAGDADDFNVFVVGHETETDPHSDGVAVREKLLREIAVHDGETGVVLVVGLNKVAAAKQRNSESSEKTWGDRRSICHRRMPVLESAVIGETVSCQPCGLGMVASPKLTESTPGRLETRAKSCLW